MLYINARYGGAARLDRGTVVDITIKVSKNRNDTSSTINVVTNNDEGEHSTITGPEMSVIKI